MFDLNPADVMVLIAIAMGLWASGMGVLGALRGEICVFVGSYPVFCPKAAKLQLVKPAAAEPVAKPPTSFTAWPVTAAIVLTAAGMCTAAIFYTPSEPPMQIAAADFDVRPAEKTLYEAISFMRSGDHVAARSLFLKACEEGATPSVCLSRAAECCYYLGDDRQALALCDDVMLKSPECAHGYYVRGLVYRRLNRENDARREWQTAAALGSQMARRRLAGRA